MGLRPVGVGSDLEAQCGRCKEVTWHVVLAMVDGRVARVQCKACGAQHRYRPPAGTGGRARKGGLSQASGAGGGGGRRARPAVPPEPVGPTVEPDLSRPIQRYRADARFQVADRVEHPRFGLGVVEAVSPGKVTVYFPEGRKILAQAKAEPRLSRPPRLRFEE